MGEAKRKPSLMAAMRADDVRTGDYPGHHYDGVMKIFGRSAAPFLNFEVRLASEIHPSRSIGDHLNQMEQQEGGVRSDSLFASEVLRHRANPDGHGSSFNPSKAYDDSLFQLYRAAFRCMVGYELFSRTSYHFSNPLTESLAFNRCGSLIERFKLPVDFVSLVFTGPIAVAVFEEAAGFKVNDDDIVTVYLYEIPHHNPAIRLLRYCAFASQPNGVMNGQVGGLFCLDEGKSLDGICQDYNDEMPEAESSKRGFAKLLAAHKPLLNLIVGAVMYVTSSNCDVVKVQDDSHGGTSQSRDYSQRGLAREMFLAGGTIKPSAVKIDRAELVSAGSGWAGVRRVLQTRFVVPGFFRRKAGAGPDAPKTEWVSAHMRGPESAPLIRRPHLVV